MGMCHVIIHIGFVDSQVIIAFDVAVSFLCFTARQVPFKDVENKTSLMVFFFSLKHHSWYDGV